MSFYSEHFYFTKIDETHWDDYFKLVSQDHVMKWVHGAGLTLTEAKRKFSKSINENLLHPILGNYSLFHNNTYAGIGKMYGPHLSAVEIGYILIPGLWGRGLGTEVCSRLIEETTRIDKIQRLVATIDPKNIASRTILSKHGFTTYGTGIERDLPAEYLERVISDKNHETF